MTSRSIPGTGRGRPRSRAAWTALILALAGSSLGSAAPVDAQSPLSLRVRGGYALPFDDFRTPPGADGHREGGRAVGVAFEIERGLGFGWVLGFSQYRATCGSDVCPGGESWSATQWELGTVWRPVDAAVAPWFTASLVLPKVERTRAGDDDVSSTSFGLEGGGGVRIRLTPRWSFEPGARAIHFDTDFGGEGVVPVTFLTVDVALRVIF